jgi:hypothetical protein
MVIHIVGMGVAWGKIRDNLIPRECTIVNNQFSRQCVRGRMSNVNAFPISAPVSFLCAPLFFRNEALACWGVEV